MPCRSRLLALVVLLHAAPVWAIGGFSPSVFQFAEVVKDDGKDGGAGWQAASASSPAS